jgi:hypothetical protein
MFATPVRVLVVGLTNTNTQAMLERWRRSGWGSHAVESVQEAETVLKTIRFKVILAAENVRDGSGYELAPLVARQGGNLFISVALSETCLWLPVIEQGVGSLGKRAVNPWILETEVEGVLRAFDTDCRVGERDRVSRALSSGPILGANGLPKGGGTRVGENLLNPSSSTDSGSRGFNGPVKHEMPPRRKASSGDGGDRGIGTPGLRELDRASGTHGKRRVG